MGASLKLRLARLSTGTPARLRRRAGAARARLIGAGDRLRDQVARRRRSPFLVRSFDVFDTVLTRTVAPPTAVFLLAGRWALRMGILDMAPGDLARARVGAERAARRGRPSGEVSLADIYVELGAALRLDDAAAGRLLALELAVEQRVLVPVPGMADEVAAARAAGSAVAFVSDMYLDASVVSGRLAAAGLLEPGDHCLLSHEHDATKASGALYDVLIDLAGCRPDRVSHLGDNQRSDVVVARRHRLVATHYAATALNRYEALLAEAAEATGGLGAAMAGASRLARLGTPAATAHQREVRDVAAGVAGPVLAGYVLWVLDQARGLGLERMCFASRDGQILAALAETLAPRLGLDLDLRYLYGGRQAWCLAGLAGSGAAGPERVPAWVFDDGEAASAAGVLARLGLAPEAVASDLAAAGFPQDSWQRRLGAAGVRRLHGVVVQPAVRRQVGAAAAAAASALVDYLGQEGLLDGPPWGIVDLGWQGRASGALAEVVERAGGPRPVELYLGLYEGPVAPGARRRAWLFESPGRDGLVRGLSRIETLLEAFAAGDHGTVLGYERSGDGRVRPRLRAPDNPEVAAWGLDTVRRAVASFVDALVVDEDLVDPWADVSPVAAGLLRELWTSPTAEEARAWGAFPYEDDQGALQHRLLAAPVRLSTVAAVLRGSVPEPHWRAGQERISSPAALLMVRSARAARRAAARRRHRATS